MKASVRQYARSLFELVADKSEKEARGLIAKFIVFLHRRQDLNKAEAIIAELQNLYDTQKQEVKAELISARPLAKEVKDKIAAYLANRVGGVKVELSDNLDPELLGGFVLRYNGLVIDGSLQNNLRKFKKQLLTN
jgi:F-type H+-transporting ATPase subunit delta